jgi:hypothetical protein
METDLKIKRLAEFRDRLGDRLKKTIKKRRLADAEVAVKAIFSVNLEAAKVFAGKGEIDKADSCLRESVTILRNGLRWIAALKITPKTAALRIREFASEVAKPDGEDKDLDKLHLADAKELRELADLAASGNREAAYKKFRSLDTFVREGVAEDVCDWLAESEWNK